MEAVAIEWDAISAIGRASTAPFAEVYVRLTKLEHIQLVMEARSWKSLHQRAVGRLQQLQDSSRRFVAQLGEQAEQREAAWHATLALAQEASRQREAALLAELDQAQAKVRDLQQRLFGRKSERSKGASELRPQAGLKPASRGQRCGAPGHGRKMLAHLPERIETVGLDSPQCPACGQALAEFPGTEDSEVLEIEVKAYRRLIRRRRYRPSCQCGCMPGIVSAPAPCRLIERGKFGISVWAGVLLDKYLYGRPSHRLLQDLGHHGLDMSPGTLTGALHTIAPMFAPVVDAMLAKLRSEQHWHADETRWAVFVPVDGKRGYRWYLWVYHSASVVHYVLDASRSAQVIDDELGEVAYGIISCDRYSAYKKFARLHPTFLLAFCWAHYLESGLILGTESFGWRVRRGRNLSELKIILSRAANIFGTTGCRHADSPTHRIEPRGLRHRPGVASCAPRTMSVTSSGRVFIYPQWQLPARGAGCNTHSTVVLPRRPPDVQPSA